MSTSSRWGAALADDLRWTLRPPFVWLAGVGVNLVFSLLWLIYQPLTGQPHRDWAILVGTYFAVFILADVTTTNVLGADHARVRGRLIGGASVLRLLVIKNATLFTIVGVPTMIATAAITLFLEPAYRLELTLPGVAFPILTWFGVGNLVSVLVPNATVSLRARWANRRDHRSTLRWLFVLGLPYALYLGVDPLGRILPGLVLRGVLPRRLADEITAPAVGATLVVLGLLCWGAGTAAAVIIAQHRPRRLLGWLARTPVRADSH